LFRFSFSGTRNIIFGTLKIGQNDPEIPNLEFESRGFLQNHVYLPKCTLCSGAGLGEVGLVDQLTFTNSQLLLRGRGTQAAKRRIILKDVESAILTSSSTI